MSVTVFLAGERLKLDDSLLLGQGGEARVFRHPVKDLALKVFHDVMQGHPQLAALRAKKLRLLPALQAKLPTNVVAPREILLDEHGELVGYAMARVKDAADISLLAKKKARAPWTANQILGVFRTLVDVVRGLHHAGVVVGDLNDGNVVLSGGAPFVIDADSMQLGGLPCPVAHERFLDPRLYGVSLVDRPRFSSATDEYALRVLLFQSLVCLHPYGGVHPVLPTLLRRAEARHSVLKGDVTLPRAALPIDALPDDLLGDFSRCFDGDERSPLDTRLLETRFRPCACGVEHARKSCPACRTAVQAPAIRTSGGVSEETIVETRGLVLLARMMGNHLAFLVEEGGRVRREDHSTVLEGPRAPGVRLQIASDGTWVGHESALVCVRGEQVVDRAHTSTMHGVPVFAAGRGGLWIVEGDTVVHHASRVRVGRVVEGQTALFSSDDGGLGAYRAGRLLLGVIFRAGAFFDAELAQPRGKLVDLDVAFDDVTGRALVGMAFDEAATGGAVRRVHALTLLAANGKRIAHVEGAPESEPILESIRGKALAGGKLLAATSQGVCLIDVDAKAGAPSSGVPGVLRTGAVFADTRPFVDPTVELLPAPGGVLVVVSPQAITRLRLKGR